MTVNAITDTKKGRTGIAPTYLHTTLNLLQVTCIGLINPADMFDIFLRHSTVTSIHKLLY